MSAHTVETAQAACSELGRQVRTRRAEVERIAADLADFEHAESLNVEGAAGRAGELRSAKANAENQLKALESKQALADNRLRGLVQEREAEREAERRKAVARLGPEYLAQARTAQALANDLGRTLDAMQEVGRQLAEAVGTAEARRLLRFGALRERVQHSFYMLFFAALDVAKEGADAGLTTQTHWLPYPVNTRGACKENLVERTEHVLDQVQDVFADEAEARRRAARIDPTGRGAHVLILPGAGLYKVARSHLRGAAAKLAKGFKGAGA